MLSNAFSSVFSEVGESVHSLAVEKGWWDQERSHIEVIGLIISEVGEAIEAIREPSLSRKLTGHKMIEEELADIFIRIMDCASKNNIVIGGILDQFYPRTDIFETCANSYERLSRLCKFISENKNGVKHLLSSCPNRELNPIEWLTIISGKLLDTVGYNYKADVHTYVYLTGAVIELIELSDSMSINLADVVFKKHEYNASRPYRHGGKLY